MGSIEADYETALLKQTRGWGAGKIPQTYVLPETVATCTGWPKNSTPFCAL